MSRYTVGDRDDYYQPRYDRVHHRRRRATGLCAENCCGIGTRLCDDPEDHYEEEDTLDD